MNELTPEHKKLFDELKRTDANGSTYWVARELMVAFGYEKWDNFVKVVRKAKTACENSGQPVDKHFFPISGKNGGKGRPQANYHLSRYASYLIAQNGNPTKLEIAMAQTYFATQTRRQELSDEEARIAARRDADWKRVHGRDELTVAENAMNKTLLRHDVSPRQIAAIRNNGDSAFFGGNNTATMKKKLGVTDERRSLGDFLALVLVSAKATATGLTALRTEVNNLRGFGPINKENVSNNLSMRNVLAQSGVVPETQPAETDIQQVYIRLGLSKGPRKTVHPEQTSLLEGE